jgi:hypothetical protein
MDPLHVAFERCVGAHLEGAQVTGVGVRVREVLRLHVVSET